MLLNTEMTGISIDSETERQISILSRLSINAIVSSASYPALLRKTVGTNIYPAVVFSHPALKEFQKFIFTSEVIHKARVKNTPLKV